MARVLGVAPRTYISWADGVGSPELFDLQRLADFFGVSLASLVGVVDSERAQIGKDIATAAEAMKGEVAEVGDVLLRLRDLVVSGTLTTLATKQIKTALLKKKR